MHETDQDLAALDRLLDDSYAAAGPHLRRIITAERRLSDLLPGAFHFGSAPDSVRFRHIRRRPHVSATHVPGEELSVTVHGRGVPIDVDAAEHSGFRAGLLEVYVPRYGQDWEQFLQSGVVYARIEADRMFTFHM
jgi:hypothetical protein